MKIEATAPSATTPAPPNVFSMAIIDVLKERTRQDVEEGWTSDHDDGHSAGELAGAAAAYACYRSQVAPAVVMGEALIERLWPFHPDWWNPTDRRHDLVKAAAMLLAEIERLDRAATPAPIDRAVEGIDTALDICADILARLDEPEATSTSPRHPATIQALIDMLPKPGGYSEFKMDQWVTAFRGGVALTQYMENME